MGDSAAGAGGTTSSSPPTAGPPTSSATTGAAPTDAGARRAAHSGRDPIRGKQDSPSVGGPRSHSLPPLARIGSNHRPARLSRPPRCGSLRLAGQPVCKCTARGDWQSTPYKRRRMSIRSDLPALLGAATLATHGSGQDRRGDQPKGRGRGRGKGRARHISPRPQQHGPTSHKNWCLMEHWTWPRRPLAKARSARDSVGPRQTGDPTTRPRAEAGEGSYLLEPRFGRPRLALACVGNRPGLQQSHRQEVAVAGQQMQIAALIKKADPDNECLVIFETAPPCQDFNPFAREGRSSWPRPTAWPGARRTAFTAFS